MTLDPQIAALITTLDEGFPPVHTMTGAEARAAIRSRRVERPPTPVDHVSNRTIPGANSDIPVRVYRPAAIEPLPILVYAHGGGFVFCDLDSHDELCRKLANSLPAVVVSVDYRLAPEHQWPTAAEDMFAAVQWCADHAAEIGGRADALAVGGDSAGGNLAAVTTLMARDRGGPALAAQLLLYPVLAADFDNASYRQFGHGYYNPIEAMRWYWDQYAPTVADRADPYASPINGDLSGLPHAILAVNGHDPLRDEAMAYSAALQAAGVPVELNEYTGAVHGFLTLPNLDLARTAMEHLSGQLAKVLQR